MSNFVKPLEDRVILKAVKVVEEKTATGLIMPGSATEKNNEAIVVAVGEGRVLPSGARAEMDVAVGDKVIYLPMAVQFFDHQGEEYMVTFTKDILAIIEETND